MELSADVVTQFGLMNKISTGHSALDVLLCLLVPFLIKHLVPYVVDFAKSIFQAKPKQVAQSYVRAIEYAERTTWCWWDDDTTPPNSILQRAVLNEVNKYHKSIAALKEADFTLRKAKTDIEPCDDDDEESNQNRYVPRYQINTVPPEDLYVELKDGIQFKRCKEESGGENQKKTTKVMYYLKCDHPDGQQRIDNFVAEALTNYRQEQLSKIDPARYMYVPVLSGFVATSSDDSKQEAMIYKRYKLSEEKTFASFFHPDKQPILTLIDNFLHKKGKFSIPGYPQKLGFLLYGPPGTGKTSFIKALAQHTGRHIVSIPLSKVRTNQELMNLMFDQRVQVSGQDNGVLLPHNKTIFVMEDVDAASNVVLSRSSQDNLLTSASLANLCTADVGTSNDQQGKQDSNNSKDATPEKMDKAFGPLMLPGLGRSLFGGDDSLNLAGLLNVLDGVVDTPGRIVVMTTNHPEKLDPALIRPGRVNKKVYMGRTRLDEALAMMRHYFGTIPPAIEQKMREAYVDEMLSPAELESMCAEYDSPEVMLEKLVPV